MPANNKNNDLIKIIRTGLVLIGLATAITMIMGYASVKLNEEVKEVEYFNEQNENIEINFEQSLSSYTQNVQEAIENIENLLPSDETEIIAFITAVEDMAELQGLDIDLVSQAPEDGIPILPYRVDFFGAQNQLLLFIEELEKLPYYTKVFQIGYEDLDLILEQNQNDPSPNISIYFDLYVE